MSHGNKLLSLQVTSLLLVLSIFSLGASAKAASEPRVERSDWTRPAYGLEVFGPMTGDREIWLSGFTASTAIKPSRIKIPFVGLAVESGVLWGEGRMNVDDRVSAGGVQASGVFTLKDPRPRKFKPYLEGSLGFTYFLKPFPNGGSKVNGLVKWGVGVECLLERDMTARLCIRRVHISNGAGLNPSNPAYDGFGLSLSIRSRR